MVVIIHGGAPEDEALAKKVKGLDVIVAGHTHKVYESVVGPKGVILSQAGAFGQFVGRLELIYQNGKVRVRKKARPHLVKIDDSVPVDKDLYDKIEGYKKHISFLTPISIRRNLTSFYIENSQIKIPYCLEITPPLILHHRFTPLFW